MTKLLSKDRYYGSVYGIRNGGEETIFRNNFHKDYDRIIFSNSFRRLSKKTQVHPLSKNDHVHNRLTHSLEVASVGRSLGLSAGNFLSKIDKTINPSDVGYIVQTACLAHDIGNPPFGHAGEEVIKEWFSKNKKEVFLNKLSTPELNDFLHLDGNAQSFRIVSTLENNQFNGGMNLTFATLATLIKYPYSSDMCNKTGKSKFNYFKSENEFFEILFDSLDLKKGDKTYKRHPLSYLMEASDDICYGFLDLQDAFELNLIALSDIKDIFIRFNGEEKVEKVCDEGISEIRKISKLVAYSLNEITLHAMDVFEKNYANICSDEQPKDLIAIFTNNDFKLGIKEAKEFASKNIFNDKRKIELELGAYNIIETLLSSLINATYDLYCKDEDQLSFRSKRALELMGEDKPIKEKSLYKMYQRVIDYIVGMTDNHAQYMANQLNGYAY